MKTIAIAGASGFVGTELSNYFTNKNFEIIKISRDILKDEEKLQTIIENCNIVINLSGANIIKRWTNEYKKILYSSRIDTTKAVVSAINKAKNKPELFISTSAVGIYKNEKTYDEQGELSDDFLAKLCKTWEDEANKADTKVSIFRFGIVLGKNGGALKQMLLPFKLGFGGVIGNGKQAFSYIHLEDLLRAYNFIIENSYEGVFNLSAPVPTTNEGLTKTLGKTLNRPTILPVPEFVLKLIFSEGAKVLSDGQSAIPKKLQDLGFEFKYKTIEETIQDLCK